MLTLFLALCGHYGHMIDRKFTKSLKGQMRFDRPTIDQTNNQEKFRFSHFWICHGLY